MIIIPAEPRRWSPVRWGVSVALVFVLQIALIFWLENRAPIVPRQVADAAPARLAVTTADGLLALENPTLFALPNRQGFSGQAWLTVQPKQFPAPTWSEPVQWLSLPAQELGSEFRHFVETNPAPAFSTIIMPEPEWTAPASFSAPSQPAPSRLRLEGGLARRPMVSPLPKLPAWTNADFLTNTVVQLLVNAQGQPVSAVLLPPGSGLSRADHWALAAARAVRFEPDHAAVLNQERDPLAGLTIGTMVFEWKTVPDSPPAATPAVLP